MFSGVDTLSEALGISEYEKHCCFSKCYGKSMNGITAFLNILPN